MSGSRLTHCASLNRRSTRIRRRSETSSSIVCRSDDVAPRLALTEITWAPVASSIQRRVLAESTSVPPQYDLPEGLVRLHQLVRGANLAEREDAIDHRSQSPGVEHR